MALQQDGGPAPYAPPSAVLLIIDQFRDRGLQTPFTSDVLVRAWVTEALANRTLTALQMLDFIDAAGDPTEAMKALRLAPTDELADRLAEHVRNAYAPIFAFTDPSQDSPQRVRDAFRGYQPMGQQQRMVTLFLGLCERAGIIESAPKRVAASGSSPRPRKQSKPSTQRHVEADNPPRGQSEGKIPGPLLALVRDLPADGRWTKTERDEWLKVFTVMLDYSIKTVDEED